MARWHAMLEYFQFPLKVLFLATVLLGVGSSIINQNVSFLWEVDNQIVIKISEMMRYGGGFLIQIFPLLVFFQVLTRKFEDNTPAFVGFISYIIINLVIIFLENTTYPTYFYHNILGLQMNFDANSIFGAGIKIPFNTGVLSLFFAYFITSKCYLKSRHYTMHGILSFIDHDTWAMLLSVFMSILVGVVFAYVWPFVIQITMYLYEYLSSDLSNPMNLFIYGIIEKVSALFGLQELPRNAFWLSELGGSATDNFGTVYQGDLGVWLAQQDINIVTTNAGHLITPYYIINIFLIPSFLLGYYSLVKSKIDRQRYTMFFVIAIAVSIFCGNALPMEIFMLILSPLLYVLYIVLVGLLYAIFQIFGVSIGYVLQGSLLVANPGSLFDLFPFFRNPDMVSSLSTISIVGCISVLVFFFATRSYFNKYAIGLFNITDREAVANNVIRALGGVDNILSVSATPDKLTVGVQHRNRVDFEGLRDLGAYLILESKDGFLIRLGNLSTIVAREIEKTILAIEQEEQES